MDDAAIAVAVAVAGGIIIAVVGPVLFVVAATSFTAGFALEAAVIIRWNDGNTPQPGQPQPPPQPTPTNTIPGLDNTTVPEEPPAPDNTSNPDLVTDGDGDIGVVAGDEGEGEEGGEEGGEGEGEGGCFVGSTPVWMADGSTRAIEDLFASDSIVAFVAAERMICRVLKLHRSIVPETLDLFFGEQNSVVTTTPKQPFATSDSSYVEAHTLDVNSKLRQLGDVVQEPRVTRSCLKIGPTEVFNLTVDVAHTYLVGDEGLRITGKWRKKFQMSLWAWRE